MLSSEGLRSAYDEFLRDPSRTWRATYAFYRHSYGPATDLRIVAVLVALSVCAIEWAVMLGTQSQRRRRVLGNSTVRRKVNDEVRDRVLQGAGEAAARAEVLGAIMREHGLDAQDYRRLAVFRAIEFVLRQARTQWRCRLLRREPAAEDVEWLTRRSLGASRDVWRSLAPETVHDLVARRLWVRANREKYMREQLAARLEAQQAHLDSLRGTAKYKRYMRMMKRM